MSIWIELDPSTTILYKLVKYSLNLSQINVGDLTEILSNGLFPATRHRVMVPEAEWKRKTSRQSMVIFVHPNNEALISPLPDLNGPPRYEPVTALQHLLNRFSATYRWTRHILSSLCSSILHLLCFMVYCVLNNNTFKLFLIEHIIIYVTRFSRYFIL